MFFYKLITTQGHVIYKSAVNKFSLLSWFKQHFKTSLLHKGIVRVDEHSFKYTVEVIEPISGVQVVGVYTLDEIKSILHETGNNAFEHDKFKAIVSGEQVTFINRDQNTVMKINTLEPFPVLEMPFLKDAMSC